MISLKSRRAVIVALSTAASLAAGAAYAAGDSAGAGVTLEMTPLGAVTATGGGHYNPLPIVTNGAARTLVAVAKGSRVQAYVDGQPGPEVNAIPVTQVRVMPTAGEVGSTGSPQFSADQKRVAYIVSLDSGKQAVVVDGVMSPEYVPNVPVTLFFAPSGHHFAYVAGNDPKGSNAFIVDDGKAGLIYQNVVDETFSADGKHFAYVGSTLDHGLTPLEVQAGKKWPQNQCAVLDGVEQKHFAKVEQPIFSQDGQHMGYLAGLDQLDGTRVVIDGQEGPAYAHVAQLALSDDGKHSAYAATKTFTKKVVQGNTTADQSYKYEVAVVDGKELLPDNSGSTQIQHLSISHDGQRAAWVQASFPLNQTNVMVIVDNGKPSQQYRSCESLQLSPDGKTLLAIVSGAQGAIILVNGQEYGPFSGAFTPAFSEDGGHWACGVTTGAGSFAILADGKTIGVKGVAPEIVAFQPGTNELLMKSPNSHDGIALMFEVKGGVASAADVPTDTVYSPNHQHVVKVLTTGYGTSEAKQKIVIDDQPAPASSLNYISIEKVAVSDDGKHVAYIGSYIGENGKALTHAVYDGTEGPGYFAIKDLALSPDGKHVAYAAYKSNGHGVDAYVVVDGMEGPAFEDTLIDGAYTGQGIHANSEFHQVSFAADGSLHFLPVKDGQLYRAWYPAGAFNALPSLAAHQSAEPGPRDVHNFIRPNVFSDPATAMHFVIGPDETIYGVSEADGKYKKGTLFKVKTDGSGFTVLHDFYGGDDDGEQPMSLMIAPDGNIIGTLARKVFHYDLKSKEYSLLTVDTKGNLGPSLLAGVGVDGSIIGFGGMYGTETGNLISMAPDGSKFENVDNGQNAKPPRQYSQIVEGKDGNFFAVSTAGGKASVVKFKSLKDTPTVVHKFVASPDDGNRPDADMVLDSKGNIYGSTAAGGASQNGVIYKISADGSKYEVVYNPDTFAFTRIFVPGDDGKLYGISNDGLLQLNPDGSGKPPVTLVKFDGAADMLYRGATPNIVFHDGAVYGLQNKAIYKVTLPTAGGAGGGAAPTAAIQMVPPGPLAAEAGAIAFTNPTGMAAPGPAAGPGAGPAAGSAAGGTPAAQQLPIATPPGMTPPGNNPAQNPNQNPGQNAANRANQGIQRGQNAINQLRGLFGR